MVFEALPTHAPDVVPTDDRRARLFVWSCWVAMLATSAYFVLRDGRNIPIQEDWLVVPAATGHQADFWDWVWEPNNEHRVPVQKLLYVALFRLWPDFRVGMVFNLLVLAGVAFAFVVFMRSLRGRTRWTDAFFPIAFLHLGNWENLGWSWQLTFVVAAALACAILAILADTSVWTHQRALLIGGLLIVVPFTGATALPFAAAVAAALLLDARRMGSTGRARRILVWSAVLTLALCALYFVDLPESTWVPPSPGLASEAVTGGKFLALGLGPAAGAWWFPSVIAVVTALATTALVLWHRRARVTWGLLAFLVSGVVLALELGQGRAGAVPYFGLPDRYVLVALPVLCAVYIVWDRHGGARLRRFGPALLCVVLAALIPLNTVYGVQWKDWYHGRVDTFARDIKAGVPLAQLEYYRPLARDAYEMRMAMLYLRAYGIGVFSQLRLIPLPVAGWKIDGFDRGGAGWETVGGPRSRGRMVSRNGRPALHWDYHTTSRRVAALGIAFPAPADWRGAGGMAFTIAGQGSLRNIRVRVTAGRPGGGLERYDTAFVDTTVHTRTVVIPWNGFGRASVRGGYSRFVKRAMPLTNIRSVTFIANEPGRGFLTLEQVALIPGHGQLGWPFHSAAERRSLPPWT